MKSNLEFRVVVGGWGEGVGEATWGFEGGGGGQLH